MLFRLYYSLLLFSDGYATCGSVFVPPSLPTSGKYINFDIGYAPCGAFPSKVAGQSFSRIDHVTLYKNEEDEKRSEKEISKKRWIIPHFYDVTRPG